MTVHAFSTDAVKEVTPKLDFRVLDPDTPESDLELAAKMLNGPWGWFHETDADEIAGRISSGNLLFSMYDFLKPRDREVLEVEDGAYQERKAPIGLLETQLIRTEGDPRSIPPNYFALTDEGRWREPTGDEDTLVLVDFTVIPSRTGKRPDGERWREAAWFMKEGVMSLFGGDTNYDVSFAFSADEAYKREVPLISNIWTYTPDIVGVVKMHERFGGKRLHGKTEESPVLWTRFPLSHASYDQEKKLWTPTEDYRQEQKGHLKVATEILHDPAREHEHPGAKKTVGRYGMHHLRPMDYTHLIPVLSQRSA